MAKRIVDPEISGDHSPFSGMARNLGAIVAAHIVAAHDIVSGCLLPLSTCERDSGR